MKEQFVTYKIALALKELGFNETCIAVFLSKDNFKIEYGLLNYPKKLFGNVIKAPLWQQVIDWFREKYGFFIEVYQIFSDNHTKIAYFYHIESNKLDSAIYDYQDLYDKVLTASKQNIPGNYLNDELYNENIFKMNFAYKTYYEARKQAILKAIEIINNDKH